jgi:isoleucyl-tRNA synthetase
LFPHVPDAWRDDSLAAKWMKAREVRRVVTGALEIERAAKRIGSGLQAAPLVIVTPAHADALSGLDLAEIAIVSAIGVSSGDVPDGAFTLTDVPGVGVCFNPAEGERCERCWRVLPDVGKHHHDGLCARCDEAVADMEKVG